MAENTTLQNNKRIAKNTLLLYFRLLVTMVVSLYTSRVVLGALGEDDFGIYNVVGGVVAMFTSISGALSSAISRFLTFELGRGDMDRLKRIFSTSVTIQLIIGVIIFILIEVAGVWFLNSKMDIPAERMQAANWVLQISAITLIINLISVPYNASIIAHERMSVFAYISIFDVCAKLAVTYLIIISPIDKLVFYSALMCVIALGVRLAYGWYCKRHFEECRFSLSFDRELLRNMFGFAGWNFIGVSSALLRDQGGNILLNLFFGTGVNAARAIATQVNSAIVGFSSNFMVALNPQITKSYANGNQSYMMTLIFQGARLSYYMLLILSLPLLINTKYILEIWLIEVPDHTVWFVRLALIFGMIEAISNPLIAAMLATGKIRNYQIVVGGLQLLNLPISYVFLMCGYMPEIVLIVALFISGVTLSARLIMLRGMINLSVREYIRRVILNISMVSIIATPLPLLFHLHNPENFTTFVVSGIICVISSIVAIYFIGCTRQERLFVRDKAMQIVRKL